MHLLAVCDHLGPIGGKPALVLVGRHNAGTHFVELVDIFLRTFVLYFVTVHTYRTDSGGNQESNDSHSYVLDKVGSK